MNTATKLYRQIHPTQVMDGRVSSQAFRPMPKDQNGLSVYDGDKCSAQESYEHFTRVIKGTSAGVLGVTVAECASLQLPVRADYETHEYHALIDFAGKSGSAVIRHASEHLRNFAMARGWAYQP